LQRDQTLDIDGFTWYGYNRQSIHVNAPKGSGGVGVLVRDELMTDYSVRVIDRSYEGVIGIQLKHKVSEFTLLIFACYLPPENSPWGRDAVSFYAHLLSQVYIYDQVDSIVFCGDFNSRVGNLSDCIEGIDEVSDRKCIDEVVNQHGRSLIDFLKESKFCILNGRVSGDNVKYTCRTGRGVSVVDYVLVPHNMVSQCCDMNVTSCSDIIDEHGLHDLLNRRSKVPDHDILAFQLSINTMLQGDGRTDENDVSNLSIQTQNRRKYNFKRANPNFMSSDICRQSLLKVVENIECNRESQNEIDAIYENFKGSVIAEMNMCIPFYDCGAKVRKRYRPRKSFWNEELQNLWSEMRVKEKIVKKCRQRGDRKLVFNNFRAAQHRFDRRFRYFERKARLEMCENIENLETQNPREFWNQLKNFGPRKNKAIPMEVYVNEVEVHKDHKVVMEKWKQDFSNMYNNFVKSDIENDRLKEDIKHSNNLKEQSMHDPLYESNHILNHNIQEGEVEKVIMKAKNGKSAGIDYLPNEVYKNENVIKVVTKLFQLCLDSGKIPSIWRKAIVAPIPKCDKNDPRIPMNYRGISLLCCSAKLYTRLLNSRIDNFLNIGNKIVDEQNGFRRDRTCQDHIFVLDSIVRNRQHANLSTFTAFVDLQKAFDCVDRDYLSHKVLNMGIDGKVYFAIKSLYSFTESCVRINGFSTDWFRTLFGVRQGDCLSPTLFSIYMNDLAREINGLNAGIEVNGKCVGILLYADDIALVAPSEFKLQQMLNTLSLWSLKWRIFVNKSKSKVMHFRNKTVNRSNYQFKCGESNLDYVSTYKYLGVTMSEFLNYDCNVDILAQSAGRALGSVVAKFKSHQFMGYSTFTKLFDSCVCPVVEYVSGVWGFKKFKNIDMLQNRAARIFLGVHKFTPILVLEGDTGWLSPRYRRWINMLRLWNRLNNLENDRLTKVVFMNDYQLAGTNVKNWCSNIKSIFATIGEEEVYNNRQQCNIDYISAKLFLLQEEEWKTALTTKPKLRFYRQFKSTLSLENYVKFNLTSSQRSVTAQLRAGVLPLHIETGRFRNTRVEDRLCNLCNLQHIEEEMHFLFDCTLYTDLRRDWLQGVRDQVVNFDTLNNFEKIRIMFEKHHRCTSKYILNCFIRRKDKLSKS
jgi:hypothetical protein